MVKEFGTLDDGTIVHLYILENDHYEVGMMDYGAAIVYWKEKVTGRNIVLGFNSLDPYIDNGAFYGATVGRVCNRIGNGTYTLNGEKYTLEKNNKGNTLHGGSTGFGHRMYTAKQEGNTITFHIDSYDGEGGFGGNLSFDAIYTLEERGLRFTSRGVSDKDTLLSTTNHAYFNLDGKQTVYDHYLQIDSDEIVPIDQNGLSLDETFEVEHTPFDFQTPKKVGQDIHEPFEQLIKGSGYDHHFIIPGNGMRHFATLKVDDLELNVYSTLPGAQIYSGNYLTDFENGGGICIETQYVPNAINSENFEKPILYKDIPLEHETFYELTVIK